MFLRRPSAIPVDHPRRPRCRPMPGSGPVSLGLVAGLRPPLQRLARSVILSRAGRR